MKRSLCLLVCFVLVVAMLTSCDAFSSLFGDKTTYAEEWSSDANGHWHAAVSGDMDATADYAAHADGNNDGKCDVCEYGMENDEGNNPPSCTDHVDTDGDGKCDNENCNADVEADDDECTDHVDTDGDGKCDNENCNADVEPAAPTVPSLVIGENNVNVTAADIEEGAVEYTLVVETAGTYTFVTDNFTARVFDAENTMIGTGVVALEPGEYSVALVTFNVPEAGEYVVTLNFTASEGKDEGEVNVGDTLIAGPNAIVFTAAEIEADTATRPLTIATAGNYQFNSGLLYISGITDSEGNDIEKNEDYTFTLAEGNYTVTFSMFSIFEVVADVENELNIVDAGAAVEDPIYLYDGANTIPVTEDDIAAGFVSTIYYSCSDGQFKFYSDIFAVTVKTEDGEVIAPVDGYVTLASWTSYTVELSTSLITEAGEYVVNVEYDAPEGSQENPIVLEELGSYVAEGVEYYGSMWYSYVPAEDGTITVTTGNDAYIGAITAVFGFESEGSLQVIAGRTYYIQILNTAQDTADINFTVAFTAGEIVRDGSVNIPYELPMGDVSVPIVESFVYYMFVADEAGTLTITTTDTNYEWYFPIINTDASYDATLTIDVVAGDVVYLGVFTANWQADTIDFNVSFEGEVEITGTTYLGYDIYGNQTLTVLVGENVKYVEFTYNHPMMMPSSATYAYDVVNGAMVLYDEKGNTLNPMAGYVTLTDGVPTGAGYNGTDYTFTAPVNYGTLDNPYDLEENNVCAFPGGYDFIFYAYTADVAGTLTITSVSSDFYLGYAIGAGDIENIGNVASHDFTLAAGEVIYIGVGTNSTNAGELTFTASFVSSSTGEGEVEDSEGTIENPYVLEENNVCAFPGGDGFVFYIYTADLAGTLTITKASSDYYLAYAKNPNNIHNIGNVASHDFALAAGETIYIGICTNSTSAGNVNFTASFTADSSGEGEGEGEDTYVTLVAGANQIEGSNVTFKYTASESVFLDLSVSAAVGTVSITYTVNDGEAVVIETSSSCRVTLAKGDVILINAVTEGGYTTITVTETEKPAVLEYGNTSINPGSKKYEFVASEAVNLRLTTGAAIGTVTFTYSVNGSVVGTIAIQSSVDVTLEAGDVLVVEVVSDGYSSLTVEAVTASEGEGEGEGKDEGGNVAVDIVSGTYEGEHSSGRKYRLVVDAEAGTMVVTKSNLGTGSLDDAGAAKHGYTYTYVDGVFTATQTSGTTTTFNLTFNEKGELVMTFGSHGDVVLTNVEA